MTITVMSIFESGLAQYQTFIDAQSLETTMNFHSHCHLG